MVARAARREMRVLMVRQATLAAMALYTTTVVILAQVRDPGGLPQTPEVGREDRL